MDERAVRQLLKSVRTGKVTVDAATAKLKDLPFAELGYATVDTHRSLRFGFPEVVYGESKTTEQILGIVSVLVERDQPILVTRLSADKAQSLLHRFPKGEYHQAARLFRIRQGRARAGIVAVVTGGTSDLPVAEEAALTAECLGATVRRV